MTDSFHSILIIGSGLAGYMLAKELRKLNQKTSLAIITASDGRFYSKPLLSTAFTSAKKPNDLTVAEALDMEKQLNTKIYTKKTVTHIDTQQHCVFIKDEKIFYDQLILACGANSLKPSIQGNAHKEILYVNDLESYARFREVISNKKRVAILGAGLVGCEFANDMVNAGYHIDLIAPSYFPLDSLLPKEIGIVLQKALSENGVIFHLGETVLSMDYQNSNYELTLSSGKKINFDVVLSAIGLRPHIFLAKEAGIATNRGILVDSYLQTNIPNVYALGDCAEVNGLVLLFVAPLLQCARALAQTLSGNKTAVNYPAMPIVIKTPSCPIVVLPPLRDLVGNWQISGEGFNKKALFYDTEKKLRGFVLTGKVVSEKQMLLKQVL